MGWSEQLQLLGGVRAVGGITSAEELHHAELPIRECEQAHLPGVGKHTLHALEVHRSVLLAAAVADVDAELHHGEAVGTSPGTPICSSSAAWLRSLACTHCIHRFFFKGSLASICARKSSVWVVCPSRFSSMPVGMCCSLQVIT